MKKQKQYFNIFLIYSLRILFLIITLGSILYNKYQSPHITRTSIFLFIITGLLAIIIFFAIKENYKKCIIISFILFIGLIFRILWFYNIDSIPVGDFNRMFICAEEFLKGSTYMFKETAYFSRFPHMTMTVIYFSFIMKIFKNALLAIRVINIIFSMINILFLYNISKEIFNDYKKSMWILFLSAIYPPMILYNNVYSSENMAIPLMLLSIWLFIKFVNNTQNKKLILLSGITLSLSHLFRPNGYVIIIAYVMYIYIYINKPIKSKIVISLGWSLSFILPLILISTLLIKLEITENHLWNGTEPISISILKGTNINSGGRWNELDASLFNKYEGDYEKVDKAAKEIIKERITETPIIKLAQFYIYKYTKQWYSGDFSGAYWSENGLDEAYNKDEYLDLMGKKEGKMIIRVSKECEFYIQMFYILILILSYIGLYKKRNNINYNVDLLYIFFGGISMQCLILESQDRYTYPFSWIFIILAMTAFKNEMSLCDGGLYERD